MTARATAARILFLLVATLPACATPPSPATAGEPGILVFYQDPAFVDHPDTVRAGESFEVRIRTYGGGCIEQGETAVEVSGLRAEIRPRDVHRDAEICTTELRFFEHRATLSFDRPGTARLEIHGQEAPADTAIVVTREVVVR